MNTHKIMPTTVSYEADLADVEDVTCMMGNGRRTIIPRSAKVTIWPSGWVHVMLCGSRVLRTGVVSGYGQVGWTIGGRWDQSADAPPIVFELIAALVPSPETAKGGGE